MSDDHQLSPEVGDSELCSFQVPSEMEEGMDFFHDRAMLIGRSIHIMQQDQLGEWSGLELMSLYKIPIDEHSSCSGVQESRGGDRGEGCWGH